MPGKDEQYDNEPLWPVIEWLEGESKPTKFAMTTLPKEMNKKESIGIIRERWRAEILNEEMKEELGFEHFEGRLFAGWHRHVFVVLCCYAFVIVERIRHFPLQAGNERTSKRTRARPSRHFADTLATTRIAIARALITWLPRCPLCHQTIKYNVAAHLSLESAQPSSP